MTKAELYALVESKIITGNRRTKAEMVRDVFNAIIEFIPLSGETDTYLKGSESVDGSVRLHYDEATDTASFQKRISGVWVDGTSTSWT